MEKIKIESISELKSMLSTDEPKDFAIINGLIRSSKSIMLNDDELIDVYNEVDDSTQVLTEKELFTESNIGEAIINGNFYFLSN